MPSDSQTAWADRQRQRMRLAVNSGPAAPARIARAVREMCEGDYPAWNLMTRPGGVGFDTFAQFVTAPEPEGLGHPDPAALRDLVTASAGGMLAREYDLRTDVLPAQVARMEEGEGADVDLLANEVAELFRELAEDAGEDSPTVNCDQVREVIRSRLLAEFPPAENAADGDGGDGVTDNYSDAEARDSSGKWTSGGDHGHGHDAAGASHHEVPPEKRPVVERIKAKIKAKYDALAERYGHRGAVAVLAGMAAMAAVPVPGAVLVPVGIAEGVRAAVGAARKLTGNEEVENAADGGSDDAESVDEIAGLMADILYGLFGDDAAKLFHGSDSPAANAAGKWDPIQHPRGERGRFIPRGSAEAVASAKEAIGRAIKGDKTTHDMEGLLGHLSILNAAQLREIQKEHGVMAPGPLKADLVAGVKDRLEASRQGKADSGKPPDSPESGKVYNVNVGDLKVDPERFQYKLGTEAGTGVTAELKQVKTWNPDFAGVVSVWKDPEDGGTYVVNGHHRHELATRLGVKDMAVRYVQAGIAKEARAVGALVNIAEGRGTAIDAAKFMRDAGASPADLESRGVSLRGRLAQDAAALTRLSDPLFDKLARGVLDESKALAVAKHLGDHDLQDQLFRLLGKREDEGKDVSMRVVEEMAREMAETPKVKKGGNDGMFPGFGSDAEESLFVQRAEVKAHVRSELAREAGDFAAVSSRRRADRVSGAGNVLDVEKNKELAKQSERAKNIFDHLVNRKGPISDAINAAAADYAKAKTKRDRDAAKQRAVEAAKSAVFAELGA